MTEFSVNQMVGGDVNRKVVDLTVTLRLQGSVGKYIFSKGEDEKSTSRRRSEVKALSRKMEIT